MYLPSREEYHETRSVHESRHRQDVSDYMKMKMDKIMKKGRSKNLKKQDYRNALSERLSKERKELRKGTLTLIECQYLTFSKKPTPVSC